MIHKIPITKARINLGDLVKRVYLKGETFVLEKNDIPIAALTPVGKLRPTKSSEKRSRSRTNTNSKKSKKTRR